jgi:ribosomal protein S18 acetylase RimI-like enzyme
MPDFEIKLLEDFELEDLCNLILEMRIPIAGLANRRIYHSIIKEALKNENIIIVIAKENRKIVGFTISVTDWKKFWIIFFQSNPIIALEIIIKKIMAKIKVHKTEKTLNKNGEELKEFIASEQTKKSWSDSSPQIAKVVYTGVNENYRKKGIATKMGRFRFKVLAERGVVRIDTNLDPKNIPTIKLNYKLGYKIYRSGNRLFVSKDLSK